MSETKDPPSIISSLQPRYLQKFDGITLSKCGSDDSDDNDDEPNTPVFVIDCKPRIEPEAEEAPRTTRERVKLASELNPGINLDDTYVASHDAASKSAQKVKELMLESSADSLLKGSVLTPGFEKQDCVPPYSECLRRIKLHRKHSSLLSYQVAQQSATLKDGLLYSLLKFYVHACTHGKGKSYTSLNLLDITCYFAH